MWCYILCNHLYVQSYECRRPRDRFREHLRDVERNDVDASKPVAKQFNLPTYSIQHMAASGLSLHLGSSERRKTLEQKFIFLTSASHSTNLFLFSRHHIPTNNVAPLSTYKPTHNHNSFNRSDEELTLETSAFTLFTVANLRFQLSC